MRQISIFFVVVMNLFFLEAINAYELPSRSNIDLRPQVRTVLREEIEVKHWPDIIDKKYSTYSNKRVNKITDQLSKVSDLSEDEIIVKVIRDKFRWNAYTYPGGYIYISQDLVDNLSDGELAYIIAHELAHAYLRHHSNIVSIKESDDKLLDYVKDQKTEIKEAIKAREYELSRKFEFQADQFGMFYMVRAGFNTSNIPPAIRKIKNGTSAPRYVREILPGMPESQHPTWDERLQEMEKFRLQIVKIAEDFKKGLEKIKGERYRSASRYFEDILTFFPKSSSSYTNLGYAYHRYYLEKKGTNIEPLPLLYAATFEPYLMKTVSQRLMGSTSDKSSVFLDKAIEAYHHALKLNPSNSVAMNNLGIAYMEKGEADKAFKTLRELSKLKTKKINITRNLGVAHFREYRDMIRGIQNKNDFLDIRENLFRISRDGMEYLALSGNNDPSVISTMNTWKKQLDIIKDKFIK